MNGRPLFMLAVPCDRYCGWSHLYPWRGDWPVTAEVRNQQQSRCFKRPGAVWLALDPERLEISQQVHREGAAEFQKWEAWWKALSQEERRALYRAHNRVLAERKARRKAWQEAKRGRE
jgi:hypothetical protein